MKYTVLLLTVLLSGCAWFQRPIAVRVPFPDAPAEMKVSCLDLKTVPENETHLSNIVGTVVENYKEYDKCRNKVDHWIEWHKQQKDISDKVK